MARVGYIVVQDTVRPPGACLNRDSGTSTRLSYARRRLELETANETTS